MRMTYFTGGKGLITAAAATAAVAAAAVYLCRCQANKKASAHKAAARHPAEGEDSTGAAVHILTDADGVELLVRHWAPAASRPCAAVLLMVHGLNWHGGWFAAAAQQFAADAIACVALDLPGYGESGSTTGVRGFHPGGLAGYAAAVQRVAEFIRQDLHPRQAGAAAIPLFLLGESMGGAVVLHLIQQPVAAAGIQGAICMAATSEIPGHLMPSDFALRAYVALARLAPGLSLPADSGFTRKEEFLSSFGDAAMGLQAWADPLALKAFPLGQVAALLPQVKEMSTGPVKVGCPVLVVHGTADVRILPDTSERLHARLATALPEGEADKTLMLVEAGRHLLFLDQPHITASVVAGIRAWICARL